MRAFVVAALLGVPVAVLRDLPGLMDCYAHAPDDGYSELARLANALAVHPRKVSVDPLWLMLGDDPRVQQILRDAIAKL